MNRKRDVVLITGANGNLAKAASNYLSKYYVVRHLTSSKKTSSKSDYFFWDVGKEYLDIKALENCSHIVHLAGYPILKKWNEKNKKIMYDSRVKSTNLIFKTCQAHNFEPKTFICASAIGIYNQNTKEINEDSPKANDWIGNMAADWEDSANQFQKIGSRVVQMRFSLIFSQSGGFLKYTLLSMKYGLGLIIGNRKRKIYWMHTHDISRFIKKSISSYNYKGPYNMIADQALSQEEFFIKLKKKLFSYCINIRIPMFLIKLFLGKRSQIINSDITLENKRLRTLGFRCNINNLDDLINNLKQ